MTNRQVGVDIHAGVTGRDSITGLADDLDSVSRVLRDDLSQQAQVAAARLRELANQDAAMTAFRRLQSEARDAGSALKAAETEATNYGRQIAAMGPPTAQEAAALQRLQVAAEGARTTFSRQQEALAGAQSELQRYGVAGQNVQAAQQRLRQEVSQVRESVQDLAPAYRGAATGAQNAGTTMNRTHRQIGEGVESISTQLGRLQSFYVGLQGLQGFKGIASDLAETADQVNNLQGRIKVVTGEGENFARAWDGVTAVALRTHSALEETGVLFTRLAQAGKDAGLTTAQASEQSLALTETINQAIQLSGAGAQASSAAITQLVQGLQGGALRGDEFNSVMEQSPRLARALADGLGVTTGELRKMAEAGLLTSDTVIKSLRGQSDTVAAEFAKLPPTVGRALQDLSTNWSLYVAETDKATGASTAVATAIDALASNLHTIAGLLVDVGQAGAAFAALKLAQHFVGLATAAQGAAVAVAATNTQMAASGAAAATATAGASRLASVLAGLRTFTLVGLITNIQDIGTWLGEGAAKLAGYKDRMEELTRAEALQAEIAKESAAERARLAAAIQLAIERQFELSKAARSSVAEFQQLTKDGTSAAEAVKKVTDNFDLSKVQGITDFAATLDKLVTDGQLSAQAFQAAWAQALSGKDLAQFEVIARAAFSGAAREGERVAQMMDGVLREAVKRTGLDYEGLQGRIGAASRSAINDVEAIIAGLGRLQDQGIDTGRALSTSLSKAIQTADSERAIDLLREKIEQVRNVLGDKIADGLLDQAREKAEALGAALDKATPGINGLREAMTELGLKSVESLQTTATRAVQAYDTIAKAGQQEGESYVAWQARKSAAATAMIQRLIEANGGVADAAIQARAQVEGLELQTDQAGRTTVRAMGRATDATRETGRSADGAANSFRNMAVSAEQAAAAAQRLAEIRERYSSPLGDDKYSSPAGGSLTGSTREERLAGQNAVDNTLQFTLRDRMNSGGLTADDADDLRAVIAALRQREQIDRDVDRMSSGAFSSQGMADRVEWERTRVMFEQALSRLTSSSSGTGVSTAGNRGGGVAIGRKSTSTASGGTITWEDGSEMADPTGEIRKALEADPSTVWLTEKPTAAKSTTTDSQVLHTVQVTFGSTTKSIKDLSASNAASITALFEQLSEAAGRSS